MARNGLGAIVIEGSDYTGVRVGEHLAPSGKTMLAALGAGGLADDTAHAASPGVRSVWGSAMPIDKDYVFDGAEGRKHLGDLFKGRRQLIVQHFMFAPDWNEGCKSC